MASSGVFVSEIVDVLVNNETVVEERAELVNHLGTPAAERKSLEGRYVMGVTPGYEYFTTILEEWVSRKTYSATLGELREVLRKCGFISTIELLESLGDDSHVIRINQSSSNPPKSKTFRFGVIEPTPYFEGRKDEVNQLTELFLSRHPPVVVLSGIGGQGKTELCRQFIKTLKNQEPCPALIWLSGDSPTNLTSSIIQLAQLLEIPATVEGRPIPIHQLVTQISDKITDNSLSTRWLVVIDNVDEVFPEFLQTVQILVRHNGFVLITSRKIDLLSGEAKPFKLNVLSEDDAQNLVRNCLDQTSKEENIQKLCKELGNHALALRHAVSYINAQRNEDRDSYEIEDYLQDFQKERSLLNEVNYVDGYDQTIFLIVTRTLNTIQENHGVIGQMAAELMEILSFVRPDGIPVDCLQKFQQIVEQNQTLDPNERVQFSLHKVLNLLKKYSLISYNDGSSISIHRLVQKVAKCHSCNDITRLILRGTDLNLSSPEELQQIIHIWDQADADFMKEFPYLAIRIFDRMYDHSLIQQLKSFAENSHQRLLDLLGPEHPGVLWMEHAVAFAFRESYDHEAALTKFLTVLEKKKRVLGEEHKSTVITSAEIATVLHRLGRYSEALEWNEEVLATNVKLNGINDRSTMTARNNLGIALQSLGRTNEAAAIYQEVLEWEKENFGHSHPSTLGTRLNIATIHFKFGQLEEVAAEFESILTSMIDVLGKDHVDTLNTKGWLASTLLLLGRQEEALRMNAEVIASREEILGPHHPDTRLSREGFSILKRLNPFRNLIFNPPPVLDTLSDLLD